MHATTTAQVRGAVNAGLAFLIGGVLVQKLLGVGWLDALMGPVFGVLVIGAVTAYRIWSASRAEPRS